MQWFRWIVAAVLVGSFAGCLPIELDVNSDGQMLISREEGWFLFNAATSKATRLRDVPAGEKPVFARFSPTGKDLLTVSELKEGFNDFAFMVTPIAGGASKKLFQTKNPTYVLYSPDGSQLGVSRVAEESTAPFEDQQLPELVAVDATTGTQKVLLANAGSICRWLPDSKSLMTLQILKKTEQDHFEGQLVIVDIATGKTTPIAAVLSGQEFHFDLSRDGKRVSLCAFAAGAVGKKLEAEEYPDKKLFLIDVAAKTVKGTDRKADVALFSPSGKQLVITGAADGFEDFGSSYLYVTDSSAKSFKKIGNKLYSGASFGGGAVYPGWISETQLYYFGEKAVYGTEGKAIQLMTIDADGKNQKTQQPYIDIVANGEGM